MARRVPAHDGHAVRTQDSTRLEAEAAALAQARLAQVSGTKPGGRKPLHALRIQNAHRHCKTLRAGVPRTHGAGQKPRRTQTHTTKMWKTHMITDAHTKTTTKSRSPPTSLAIVEFGEGADALAPRTPQPKHTFQHRQTLMPVPGAQVTDRGSRNTVRSVPSRGSASYERLRALLLMPPLHAAACKHRRPLVNTDDIMRHPLPLLLSQVP